MKSLLLTALRAGSTPALVLSLLAAVACSRQAPPVSSGSSVGAVVIGRFNVTETVRPGEGDKKLPILRQRIVAKGAAGSWRMSPVEQGLATDFYLVLPPGTYALQDGYAHSGATDGLDFREAGWHDTGIEFVARSGETVCIGEVVGVRRGGAAAMLLSVITEGKASYEFGVIDSCAEIAERFGQRHPGKADSVTTALAALNLP